MEERNYNKVERFDAKAIEELKHHYTEILRLLGEDPAREGLQKTPERVAKAMSFLTKGYDENPLEIIRSATFREEYKQMVLVKDIELYSLCEHHMLPFYGKSWVLLVAEDSDTNFRLIEAVLSRRFSLVRAHTGAEAVDMFGTVQPDAVLMDIRMPVMDGLEATRRIRSVSADVPIIAMSAYSSGSEIESARNAGCNEFLVKPLSQYSLHRALNAALVEFKGKGKS